MAAGSARAGSIELPHHERRRGEQQDGRRRNVARSRSASSATGGFSSDARCASRWISATRVCAGRSRATTVIGCARFIVPANTACRPFLRPVAIRRSTSTRRLAWCRLRWRRRSECANRTRRRCGRRGGCRPARCVRRRPCVSRDVHSGSSASQLSNRASRWRVCCSRKRAPSSRNVNIVTESKYTSPVPRTVATTLATYATPIASATGTSIASPGALLRPHRVRDRNRGVAEERPRRIEHHGR